MTRMELNSLTFRGSNYLRQRLILSVLTGKTIRIRDIRSQDSEPGLREYEVNLLRLIDKMTNGTCLEVNETGTSLLFTPGSLYGGTLDHECCKLRGIGYYLEVIFALSPFCKKPLDITMRGVTNNDKDPSVDAFKTSGLSVLKQFIVIDPGIEFHIKKRGMEPEGGGEIRFVCPNLKLKAVQKEDMGKVKRIRGTVFALRVSPVLCNRFIESAKGELLNYLPDVFLTADHLKGQNSGKSPGFGGCLVAETTTGVVFVSEAISLPPPAPRVVPEDLGRVAAWRLLEEISRGGLIDSLFQSLACLYMIFTQKDVSKIITGPLTPYTIEFLRHVKVFLSLMFKLEPLSNDDEEEENRSGTNKVVLTAVGVGYSKII